MKNILVLFLICGTIITSTSCKKAEGEKATVAEAAEVAVTSGKTLAVDLSSSVINWEGAKPSGTHTGTMNLSEGSIAMEGNDLTGGSFTIDMNSITNTDMEGDSKTNLENHLKGFAEGKEDHFFDVAKHPTGKFEITKVSKVTGDETATHLIYGNLTLKGITKEVGFKALIGIGTERIEVTTPPFTIDRTQWGVNYGSKTVFDDLGDKFVNDEVGLTITLKAGKEPV